MSEENPEEIHDVSHSQFSIARYYGGCKLNGVDYHYDPERDVLVRHDVLSQRKREAKERVRDQERLRIREKAERQLALRLDL